MFFGLFLLVQLRELEQPCRFGGVGEGWPYRLLCSCGSLDLHFIKGASIGVGSMASGRFEFNV